jgi:guanine deaminase
MSQYFLGNAYHAPKQGEIEFLRKTLIEVDGQGNIQSLMDENHANYQSSIDTAEQEGTLTILQAGQYLLPGLIDLHIHAPQFPQLGKALHLPLEDWLQQCTFPLEARYQDEAFAANVYQKLVSTLLANGTTTGLYFATLHLEASTILAKTCLELGQRAFVGKLNMDNKAECPEFYCEENAEVSLETTIEFINRVKTMLGNDHQLVQPVITPRFIPSCSDQVLEGLGEIAEQTDCHIQTHCSESDWEHNYVIDRHGKTDSHSLNDFGLLTRHTILAHSNFISEDDCDVIQEKGAGIAHCPLSNYYFSNAVFPLRRALDRQMHVGLGTDISGGPSASIIENCRHAVHASRLREEGTNPALEQSQRGLAGSRIDFMEAFWCATRGGAIALDIPAGSFEVGHKFDAFIMDINAPNSNITAYDNYDDEMDILQKIISGAGRQNVMKTWVDGKLVYEQ